MSDIASTAQPSAGASNEATGATTSSPAVDTNFKAGESPHARQMRMETSMRQMREGREARSNKQAGNDVTKANQRAQVDGADAGTQRPNPKDGKATATSDDATKAKEGKADPGSVPLPVFKERLAKVQAKAAEKHQELQSQVNTKDLELANSREAFKLLSEEFDEFKRRAVAGELPDDRDEQLRGHELEKKARDAVARNTKAHEERLAKQTEAASQAEEQEAQAERVKSIGKELDEVLADFPMLHRRELIAEKHALQESTGQLVDTRKLAADLNEKKMALARGKLTSPTPALPQTARSEPSGNPVARRVFTAKAYEARLGEIRKAHGGA